MVVKAIKKMIGIIFKFGDKEKIYKNKYETCFISYYVILYNIILYYVIVYYIISYHLISYYTNIYSIMSW